MNPVRFLRALQFASHKHRDQRRKDVPASPYINHPIAVAAVLVAEGGVTDDDLLVAALLHDTVEDTDTTIQELESTFGSAVASLVEEMTDNKELAKDERKRLQIENAPGASDAAKQLKIADKICNIRDITASPPRFWTTAQQREYLSWAQRVVEGCRGVNPALDTVFDSAVKEALQRITHKTNTA